MEAEKCCVCGHAFDFGERFDLTPEERAAIGPTAPVSVSYCRGCLKVMRHREQGAQLLKGVFEASLREHGVPDAKERAEEFHANLLAAATKKLQ